jgi:hypothetical protein
MRTDPLMRFIVWLFSAVLLGALPWLVNLLALLVAGQVNFYSVCRVNDLMSFVIILSATTMLDLLISNRVHRSPLRLIFFIILLIMIIPACVLLGISSYYTASPPTSGLFAPLEDHLIWTGLSICTVAFTVTLIFQIYFLRCSSKIHLERNI